MESNRKPTKDEKRLIEFLVHKASIHFPCHWKTNLLVQQMNDDGMGSLYLFPNGIMVNNRLFGECVSEHIFLDKDGIEVIVSLNVDQHGDLYELDIWKTDFSPLICIPKTL
jgi:hypothetical protein